MMIGYRLDVAAELLEGFHLAVFVDELCGHVAAHAVGLERGEHGVVGAQRSMKSPPASLPENPASVAASNIRLTSSKSSASISVRGLYRRS